MLFNDPSGHMRTNENDTSQKGCTNPKYCEGGKPKVAEKLKPKRGALFYSFDGGWNDPKYSTWNLLRRGAACTACHVTHDEPGDWGIPTNSELDPSLVSYYRSLDKTAHQVHWTGFMNVNTYSYLARETIVIGHYNENPSYIDVAKKTGANYFQVNGGLTAEQVAVQNEKFIVDGVQNGCRFVQCSAPVRSGSGLESEIRWLEPNGYSTNADMTIEIATDIFNSAAALFGFTNDD